MAFSELHPRSDLLRYLDGGMAADEKYTIEKHLADCESCRNYLTYIKDFSQGLAELTDEEFTATEPHPNSWTLVAYEAGQVDDETARHLRAHLLFCDDCANEFYALRKSRGPNWTRIVVATGEKMLRILGLSGSGSLLEPALAGAPFRHTSHGGPNQVDVGGEVVDPDSGETSLLRVSFESELNFIDILLRFEADPPHPNWQVRLLAENRKELASLPVASSRIILSRKLQPGDYVVEVHKGATTLAIFDIELIPSNTSV